VSNTHYFTVYFSIEDMKIQTMRKPSNLDYVTQPKKIQEKDSFGDKMHEGFRFAWQIWFFRSGEARRVALTG
jgi:hypothetical protein